MKQKKLMLLGGIRHVPLVIDAAHTLAAYVITADVKVIVEDVNELLLSSVLKELQHDASY